MERDQLREATLFKNYRWNAPKYYDYPDGQDLMGKLSFTTKMGFFTGGYLGLLYADRKVPVPKTSTALIIKALTIVPAFVAAPFVFTTVTYSATNIRKKDDQINYVLGGFAAGVVGTTLLGLQRYTMIVSITFAALGFAKKTAEISGTKLFPRVIKKMAPPYYERVLNLSSTKEGEPSWTSTLPAEQK